jgi:F-type H+-transporting ATPase subunit epsilon
MAFTIKVDIVSAESNIYSGNAKMVFLTGEMGELGIAPGHSQLLTRLKPGHVRLQLQDDTEEVFYISGGFAEIQPDIVTVLADTAERAQDIDEIAAIEAHEEAERLLRDNKAEVDYAEVLSQLAQAAAQLQAIQQLKRKLR